VGVQLVLRDSLAAIELLDAARDLRVDRFPVLGKPAILFLLRSQQTKQHLFNAGGAGGLELSLDAGLESRIADFDAHCSVLHTGSTLLFFILAEASTMSSALPLIAKDAMRVGTRQEAYEKSLIKKREV